jgi:hypothetical protein
MNGVNSVAADGADRGLLSDERPEWQSLPMRVRGAIEAAVGGVVASSTPSGGFGGQFAAVLDTADGRRVFAKSCRLDHGFHAAEARREYAIAEALSGTGLAAELLDNVVAAGWVTHIFAFLPGRSASLEPGARDLPAVVDLLIRVASTPVRAGLRAAVRGPACAAYAYLHGWGELASSPPADLDPWAAAHLAELRELESQVARHLGGDHLAHGDIRSDNILVHAATAHLIDWPRAVIGPAWLDRAQLAAHLVLLGWDPDDAWAFLASVTAAPKTALQAYFAALSGCRERLSREPAPAGARALRAHQARADTSALRLLRAGLGDL